MSQTLGATRENVAAGDDELQRLLQEHSRYETQLRQLSSTPYLNAEDILLEADLKKLKLRAKDEMLRRRAQLSRSGIAH